MTGRTMAFELVHQTLIVVHGPKAAAPDEWTAYATRSEGADYEGIVVVVDREFPGPSSAQRAAGSAALKRRGTFPNIAVVTPSTLHRGIVSVLGWLQRNNLSAFQPGRFEQALRYAKVPETQWPSTLERVHALATQLDAPWIVESCSLATAE